MILLKYMSKDMVFVNFIKVIPVKVIDDVHKFLAAVEGCFIMIALLEKAGCWCMVFDWKQI